MEGALWASKTGLDAQQTRMTVIANNLANVSTTGFKKSRPVFEDLLYQNVTQSGAQSSESTEIPTGMYLGTGVRIVATEKQHTQGSLTNTNKPLDVAIDGRGYFEILLPDGASAYTRDGTFQINSDGEVVTASGYRIQPSISIPSNAQNITIGKDGTVSVQLPDQTSPAQVGTLTLVDFINPPGLEPRGENLFLETQSSGPPTTGTPGLNGLGLLIQGALENSNVNVVEELVAMIETQRAYEMNSKAISTTDQMLQYLNNNV